MAGRGSNYYPLDGPDWLPTDPIRRLADHSQAQKHERYTHDVAHFRQLFFTLMDRHKAVDDGLGWAVFFETADGNVAEEGNRELLFVTSITDAGMDDHIVPNVRIITNEEGRAGDKVTYLSEDVTVRADGTSRYYASGVVLDPDDQIATGSALATSLSPIFNVRDGQLMVTSKFGKLTPLRRIHSPKYSHFKPVMPYGDNKNLVDMQFALDKGRAMLQAVVELEPFAVQQSDSE